MMNIVLEIRRAGEPTGRTDAGRRQVCKVKCQGCGEIIFSDQDLANVEYVKTKRGTDLFFHSGCANRVWMHGIV